MENRPLSVPSLSGKPAPALRLRVLTIALGMLIAPIASAQSAFLSGGQELSVALKEYAQSKGWALRWKAGEDYYLDVDQVLPGQSLVGDIEHVLKSYQDRGALEGVGIELNGKAKTIALVKGARRAPVTDPAIAMRAAVIGKEKLGVDSPAALALSKPMTPVAPAAPMRGATTSATTLTAAASLPALGAAPGTTAPMVAPPPVVVAPQQAYAVLPGELMSETLERWTKGSTHRLVWQANSDFRMQAGTNFYGKTLLQAVEELASIVSKTQSGLRVEAYRNGVIVVSEAGK